MVLVFFLGVCCLLFLCVVHKVTVLVKKFKKFESTIVDTPWFCGFTPLV